MTGPWRKSTRCGGSTTCVEVGWWAVTVGLVERPVRLGVLIRDSADPDSPQLALTRSEFAALLNQIKEGR